MIVKLHKPLSDFKIGLIGFRAYILGQVLLERGLSYTQITDVRTIDESFDIVFGTGVYFIVPKSACEKPKYGCFGFHESPLPEGRGHAPLQWAILNGRKNLTISAFRFVSKVDAGEILYQYNVPIEPHDTKTILENKRVEGIRLCFIEILREMEDGVLVLREQSGSGSYHEKRSASNSQLDENKSLKELWDNIRACDNEEYPAFFFVNGKKVILRYEVQNDSQ